MLAPFSASATKPVSAPSTNLDARRVPVTHRSPAILIAALALIVFLLRLPAALMPLEFNVDESQLLAEAMKLVIAPWPWKSVDSCGVLSSGFLSIFLWLGFKPGYVLAHVLATLLVCVQVFLAYLTLRRMASERAAVLGGLLVVLVYGLPVRTDYLEYSTELLPAVLTMLAFYAFVRWLDDGTARHRSTMLAWCFVGGLALGAAPWGKLQALPITGALGLLYTAAILRARPQLDLRSRLIDLLCFLAGSVAATVAILAVVATSGAFRDFWYSYLRAPLAFVGGMDSSTTVKNVFRLALTTPVLQLLLASALGVALLDFASSAEGRRPFSLPKRWDRWGLAVYFGAALFTACRSNNFWYHHAIFFVPPMTYVAALTLDRGLSALKLQLRDSGPRILLTAVAPMFLLLALLAVYGAYAVRYVQKVGVMHRMAESESRNQWSTTESGSDQSRPEHPGTLQVHGLVSMCIGPLREDLPDDGVARIAHAIEQLRRQHPVQSLSVWGWQPGIYVRTGLPPGTRDTITERAIDRGPLRQYFQERFVRDLRENPPDLFVDTISDGLFIWRTWSEEDGYESNPQLRKFIDDNYFLSEELVLKQGTKPVRFFSRRRADLSPQ